MSLHISKADLTAMSVGERLQLLEDVWESLRADQAAVPVPTWHEELLDQRMAEARENPADVEPWEDVQKRLERRLAE